MVKVPGELLWNSKISFFRHTLIKLDQNCKKKDTYANVLPKTSKAIAIVRKVAQNRQNKPYLIEILGIDKLRAVQKLW